ncbi:MAG: hypothetical protein GY953_39425 [bacterium]|nr:hypothetical protein [bacterium]
MPYRPPSASAAAREVRSATVRALGDVRVLRVDKKNFLRGIHEDPSLAFRIVQTMSKRIRALTRDMVQTAAHDRRDHRRVAVSARVSLLRDGQKINAVFSNLSKSGGLIEVHQDLEQGQSFLVDIPRLEQPVEAQVMRKSDDSHYGVRFTYPLKARREVARELGLGLQ